MLSSRDASNDHDLECKHKRPNQNLFYLQIDVREMVKFMIEVRSSFSFRSWCCGFSLFAAPDDDHYDDDNDGNGSDGSDSTATNRGC